VRCRLNFQRSRSRSILAARGRAAICAPEKRNTMVRNFDHITIVVRDVAASKRFFALLGFKEVKSVVISGKVMEDYMGIKGIEADHVTLAIENPHTECSFCPTVIRR
jgi:Glyoxalase/Bleomycin resistance protein/Dioxygenase superfamily